MTLTTHAAIGAAIGLHVGNPALGFVLGIISHLLVDMIPHGDAFLSDQFRVQKRKKAPVTFSTADALIGIFLLAILATEINIPNPTIFAWAIAGSVLPDILVILYDLTKSKYLYGFYKIHFFFHDFFLIRYKDIKLQYSLAAQVCLILFILSVA